MIFPQNMLAKQEDHIPYNLLKQMRRGEDMEEKGSWGAGGRGGREEGNRLRTWGIIGKAHMD